MPTPVKPWKSFEEQLSRLKERGMQVDNDGAALGYLERLGYYRLSGYWYPLREIDKLNSTPAKPVRLDNFVEGSRFEDVVRLYVFDKKLRLLAWDALERIEMAVRVDVAHLLGGKDPLAHENPDCLHGDFTKKINPKHGKTEHALWLEKYQTLLSRARREPFVIHHQQNYGGNLPIWVAIELWDFGLLSKLFSGMRFADKNSIAAKYGAKDGRAFAQWLHSLNFIRNVSAHHSRLWNINVPVASPSTPVTWPKGLSQSRPFFYFLLMGHLLKVISPQSCWGQRLQKQLADFPAFQGETPSLRDFGALQKWEAWIS